MPVYGINELQAGIVLKDKPLPYEPAFGPLLDFTISHDQFDNSVSGTEPVNNLGPKWIHNWASYVEELGDDQIPKSARSALQFQDEDVQLTLGGVARPAERKRIVRAYAAWSASPSEPTQPALMGRAIVNLRGGGGERYSRPAGMGLGAFPEHPESHAIIEKIAERHYRRTLLDGTIETYTQAVGWDGTQWTGPRKIYLTSVEDARGNLLTLNYDTVPMPGGTGVSYAKLSSITDATQRTTTFIYDPQNERRLLKVVDPHGRYVEFAYDSAGRLERVFDPARIESSFVYLGSRIISMVTPYGTSSFDSGTANGRRWLEAWDADGNRERVEYRTGEALAAELVGGIPSNRAVGNLSFANTLRWGKKAMKNVPVGQVPPDSEARITNWLYYRGSNVVSAIPGSIKEPLESRVWFEYPDSQQGPAEAGETAIPLRTSRILDGDEEQITETHSVSGQITQTVDPLGRTQEFTYHVNGVDVDEVRQGTGPGAFDVVSKYSSYSNRQPTLITDLAGQQTTLELADIGGQLSQVTNPKGEVTKITYVPVADPGGGKIATITQGFGTAFAKTMTFEYDSFDRVEKITDQEDAYEVSIGYDAIGGTILQTLDRPTTRTYPDGTFEQLQWSATQPLQPEWSRDRLGRKTYFEYDALGRRISTTDPENRTTTLEWCSCGSLAQITSPSGGTTSWVREVNGRPKEKWIGTIAEKYTYDAAGRLKSRTEARGKVANYSYATDDRLTGVTYTETDPLGGGNRPGTASLTSLPLTSPDVAFHYEDGAGKPDPYGRLLSMNDASGETTYSYVPVVPGDNVFGDGGLLSVDGPLGNDTLTYSYDRLGRALTGPTGNLTGYDALGRVLAWSNALGTFTPHYAGKTTRVDWLDLPGGGKVDFDWYGVQKDFRLKQIVNEAGGGVVLSRFDYDSDSVGRTTRWEQWHSGLAPAAGTVWRPGYDGADQLTGVAIKDTGETTTLKQFRYFYDAAGNRYATADWAANVDLSDQLTSTGPGGLKLLQGTVSEASAMSLGYWKGFNWVEEAVPTQPSGTGFTWAKEVLTLPGNYNSFTLTAEELNVSLGFEAQRTVKTVEVPVAETEFTYDEAGNLLNDGATRGFEWDAAGRLAAITYTGTDRRTEFSYDGLGRRVRAIEKDGPLC